MGYQSDYGNFNPTNWTKDGKYRHNHALRMAISSGSAFGEPIDTTTKDHFEYRKYATTLPENITNLDVVLYNLHVVAFVSETQSNIYSGAGTVVEFDPSLRVDLGLKNITPINYCSPSINPKIEVTNNSGKTISNFDVSLYINGDESKKSFIGELAKDEKTILDWGEIPYNTVGAYDISFIGFTNINNNSDPDMDYSNDAASFMGIKFMSKAFSVFNGNFDGIMPDNSALDKNENPSFVMTNNPSCGANYSSGAVRFALHDSWGASGKPGHIVFGEAELSKLSKPYLYFYYAYSDDAYGGTTPTIKIQVSEDYGVTWSDVNTITPIETGQPAQHGNWYVPASNEYKLVETNLDAYKDKSVIIRITGIPGTGGNAMYIDEISVASATAVEEKVTASDNSLYPNPATTEIQFGNEKYLGLNYSIYSIVGNIVANGMNINNKIDISKLTTGQYYIKINNEILKFVKY